MREAAVVIQIAQPVGEPIEGVDVGNVGGHHHHGRAADGGPLEARARHHQSHNRVCNVFHESGFLRATSSTDGCASYRYDSGIRSVSAAGAISNFTGTHPSDSPSICTGTPFAETPLENTASLARSVCTPGRF